MDKRFIRVVVVGAGFAGLTAAAELSKLSNINVTLLEASDYLGGRVKQVSPFKDGHYLDIGGEFIHGENTDAIQLAKEHGWKCEELETCYAFIGNKLLPRDRFNRTFLRARNAVERFEESGREIRRQLPGLACEPLSSEIVQNQIKEPEKEVLELARQRDLSLEKFLESSDDVDLDCKSFIDVFYCQSEGNDLSSIGMLEFSRSSDSWNYGSRNFRLEKSYKVLLDLLIEQCTSVDIRLKSQVQKINWNENVIQIINQESTVINCDYVVVAVPLTVLKDRDIKFSPDIHYSKGAALNYMEMRNGCKIFCSFSRMFWPSDMTICYSSEGPFTQVWTEPSFNINGQLNYVLCGFSTGSKADVAGKYEKELLKDEFLKELDKVFGSADANTPASENFVDYYFYDWGSNPYIRGCYSSPVVQSYALSAKLAEPLGKKLFFAGEATNPNGSSSVQSAIDSGKRVVKEILNCCGLSRAHNE